MHKLAIIGSLLGATVASAAGSTAVTFRVLDGQVLQRYTTVRIGLIEDGRSAAKVLELTTDAAGAVTFHAPGPAFWAQVPDLGEATKTFSLAPAGTLAASFVETPRTWEPPSTAGPQEGPAVFSPSFGTAAGDQTISITIDCWSGGHCALPCGGVAVGNYDCSDGTGTWTPRCAFNDPVPPGNVVKRVTATVYSHQCSTSSRVETTLNGIPINTVTETRQSCRCTSTPCLDTLMTSDYYPYGFLGYQAGGTNTFGISVPTGTLCVQDVKLDLVYGPIDTRPVGWWKLDGNAQDSSASGLHGTASGPTFERAHINQGATFGHGPGSIEIPSGPLLDFADRMTVVAWVKPNRFNATQTIVNRWDGSPVSNWNLGMERGSWTWSVIAGGLSKTIKSPASAFATPDGHLPQGLWTHLAATYDGGTMRLFVNGTQVASDLVSGVFPGTSLSVMIGNRPNKMSFAGQIDDVRLFAYAMSPTEIADLANEVWPNTRSWANSDAWLAEHHAKLRHLNPTVLALNFVVGTTTDAAGMPALYGAANAISEGSRYHGYQDPAAEKTLEYNIIPVDMTAPVRGETCAYAGRSTCLASSSRWDYDDANKNPNSACYPRRPDANDLGFAPNGTIKYSELFSTRFANFYRLRDETIRILPLCELISSGRVHEVWIHGSADNCDVKGFEVVEVKPLYDANRRKVTPTDLKWCAGNGCFSELFNDEDDEVRASPGCGGLSRSIRVLWIQYNAPVGSAMDSAGHGFEGMAGTFREPPGPIPYLNEHFRRFGGFDRVAPSPIPPLRGWYDFCAYGDPGCLSYTITLFPPSQSVHFQNGTSSGDFTPYFPACGNAHFPMNATSHYDHANTTSVLSSCENFGLRNGASGSDRLSLIGANRWLPLAPGDDGAAWNIYWRQNMPGVGNAGTDAAGDPMLWWLPFLFY